MLSRTENLATAALCFDDRVTNENHYTQGLHSLTLGAADINAKTHLVFHLTSSGCGAGGRPMC